MGYERRRQRRAEWCAKVGHGLRVLAVLALDAEHHAPAAHFARLGQPGLGGKPGSREKKSILFTESQGPASTQHSSQSFRKYAVNNKRLIRLRTGNL